MNFDINIYQLWINEPQTAGELGTIWVRLINPGLILYGFGSTLKPWGATDSTKNRWKNAIRLEYRSLTNTQI